MTVGFRNSAGVDLDSVFDPYVQGTKPAATGFRDSAGVDLNQRYAPLVFGSAAAATGMRIASGADLNTLWAAAGTASYAGPKNPGFATAYSVDKGGIHDVAATCQLTVKSDGTWTVTNGGTGGVVNGSPTSGTWHTNPAAGVGAGCQLRSTTGGAFVSLSTDKVFTVNAFASSGGNPFDSETMNLQFTFKNNDGTNTVSDNTSITASASV